MRQVIGVLAALLCALAGLHTGAAQGERRVALVIGNAAYRTVGALPNPKKDASDVAAALKGAGFEVVERYDLGVQQMREALSAFESNATGADWAVVYYAGHGIEVDGRNFLVPVDASLARATDVEDETLGLDRVLARVAAASKLQLVILDACRNNPFKARMAGAGRKRVIGERGLARFEPEQPNILIAYAARDGEAALDGKPGGNSPYAKALAKYLAEPGLEVGKFFRKVRDDVLAETGGQQRPFEYGSLTGQDLYFRPAKGPAGLTPGQTAATAKSDAAEAWAAVKDTTSIAQLEVISGRYIGTVYADLAEARIAELRKLALAAPPTTKPAPPVVSVAPPKVLTFNANRAPAPLTAHEESTLKPKDSFKECTECPEMVVVPAGSFMMGSSDVDKEKPPHRVTIQRPFAVGKFEVTFAEWDACVLDGACQHRPNDEGWGRGRRPVINVVWNDAKQYAAWLSRKTVKTYRLLSEAEWEYAARAGTTTSYSWGDSVGKGNANCQGCGSQWDNKQTAPVGSFKPNAWGLYDMHGNVWEWCEDNWHPDYNGAPQDGSVWTGGDASFRILRGGDWGYAGPAGLRSAYRFGNMPSSRLWWFGFRLVRTL